MLIPGIIFLFLTCMLDQFKHDIAWHSYLMKFSLIDQISSVFLLVKKWLFNM